MTLFKTHARARISAVVLAGLVLLSLNSSLPGQEPAAKLPERSGYVNDFAGVIDTGTKARLEAILANLKQRTDIEFVVATVKTLGTDDVYKYSLRLANDWDIGVRTSPRKTILLLLSAAEVKYFTRLSSAAQRDLPDGVVGELILRGRPKIEGGDFSGGLLDGIKSFVTLLGERKDFKFEDLDQPPAESTVASTTRPRRVDASADASPLPSETPAAETPKPTPGDTPAPTVSATPIATESIQTPVASPSPSETPVAAASPSETPTPAAVESPSPLAISPSPAPTEAKVESLETPAPSASAIPSPQASETPAVALPAETTTPQPSVTSTPPTVAANRSRRNEPAKRTPTPEKSPTPNDEPPANPDDEIEEVELTLTLPVDKRIPVLKSFIAEHPKSVAVPRANELIVAAHASIGDQKLQAGDIDGGLEQFRLAMAEAPTEMSDRLFTEVIARLPMNLFLRGQPAAALDFARRVEAMPNLNPKRLLAIGEYYVNTENVAEASRIAELAVQQAPEMAAAHQALGAARHIALRLDDAEKEYTRALELEPKSATARRSLADLKRAGGKPEEALTLYREALAANASDKTAFAGMVVSLLESGKKEEADQQLDAALKDKVQSRNLALLVGTAYWFAAHGNAERALELSTYAVQIEPRYSWAQIASARALLATRRPLEAERALRYARQFGRFPTIDYELAGVLASAGLFDEAAQELARSFSLKDGQIETRLAGRNVARSSNFIELLGPERRATIFQPAAADSESNARMLKALLTFVAAINPPEGAAINEAELRAAALEFTAGTDAMRAYRQVFAAGKLIKKNVALNTALELTEAAIGGVEAALDVPAATVAAQPEELADIRARALSQGGTPDIPDAPRTAISGLLRGRIEDLAGLALSNQEKPAEAVAHLRRAVNVLPEGTPLLRAALWHLGSALEGDGQNDQALSYYIKSYVITGPDPVRRAVIERIYKKINGSLDGLDDKIGPRSPNPTAAPLPASKEPSPLG